MLIRYSMSKADIQWNSATKFLCIQNFQKKCSYCSWCPIGWPKKAILYIISWITLDFNRKCIKLCPVSAIAELLVAKLAIKTTNCCEGLSSTDVAVMLVRCLHDAYTQYNFWQVVTRTKTPQEILEEFERLEREKNERRLQQQTNPKVRFITI